MARCLHVLRRNKEALYSIEQFIKKFPTHANTIACKALLLDIREDSVEVFIYILFIFNFLQNTY